jgi:hypothetical protein
MLPENAQTLRIQHECFETVLCFIRFRPARKLGEGPEYLDLRVTVLTVQNGLIFSFTLVTLSRVALWVPLARLIAHVKYSQVTPSSANTISISCRETLAYRFGSNRT